MYYNLHPRLLRSVTAHRILPLVVLKEADAKAVFGKKFGEMVAQGALIADEPPGTIPQSEATANAPEATGNAPRKGKSNEKK